MIDKLNIVRNEDSSGTISTLELLHVLRAMGQNPSEEELNGIVMEIDIDGSGTIDFDEFVALMKDKALEVDVDSDIREAFRMFDRNKDGYIDMAELSKMFAVVGGLFSRDEMEEFMMEADKVLFCLRNSLISAWQDGNGKIDYEEFIKILKKYDWYIVTMCVLSFYPRNLVINVGEDLWTSTWDMLFNGNPNENESSKVLTST